MNYSVATPQLLTTGGGIGMGIIGMTAKYAYGAGTAAEANIGAGCIPYQPAAGAGAVGTIIGGVTALATTPPTGDVVEVAYKLGSGSSKLNPERALCFCDLIRFVGSSRANKG
mmetsp:Transcript_11378/g.17248  ORF Transcript_11378/g.17248 Transcript_11378/m.17248 type:complete len:113 (+) Transcript_11378:138-476(+)